MEAKGKRLGKPYLAISASALLVTAFVLVQPALNQAYAVGVEGLPAYDNCDEAVPQSDDIVSMNTVRNKDIVKTIHAEKEIFECFLEQGGLEVIVDLTTYLEVYENITSKKVIDTNAIATTCLKDEATAQVIDCEAYEVSTSPVFVGSDCEEETQVSEIPYNTHPQEMNTVTKGKIAKTVESQKEIFECDINGVEKKVDIVLFTEIYEDLNTQTTTDVQFLSARCIVLRTDDGGDLQDAFVESCIFTQIEN